jgi:TATA-box binding protein (TBP) (component of TFIID and TFIIIB)
MADYEDLHLCKNEAGYEAEPRRDLDLDLGEAEETLEDAGWTSRANAGMVLVVERDHVEVSVFDSGKIMVKSRDEDEARGAFQGVRDALDV